MLAQVASRVNAWLGVIEDGGLGIGNSLCVSFGERLYGNFIDKF